MPNKTDIRIEDEPAKGEKSYQNPERYFQVHYDPIRSRENIPDVGYGWEGMRTYKFAERFGLPNKHNFFTISDEHFVRDYQKKHHLKVTGRLDYDTWLKMGFTEKDWIELDNYIPETTFKPTDNRLTHINAGIEHIKKYIGGLWIAGTSSNPKIKKADCSGLATQYLLAGGIYTYPVVSPMIHATPGNEWDSKKLWATKKLKKVPFEYRERGDLIFFSDPKTNNIWHVGILVTKDVMLDSWPPKIKYTRINDREEHGNITGIKRPFL